MEGIEPVIYTRQADLTMKEVAKAQGKTGHYVATLTFPQAGGWTWSIFAFTCERQVT